MIIKETYKKIGEHTHHRILEATCDMCGADCMKPSSKDDDGDRDDKIECRNFEGMKLKAVWGYDSDKDGELWTAVVCEECVDNKFKDIPFIKKYYVEHWNREIK